MKSCELFRRALLSVIAVMASCSAAFAQTPQVRISQIFAHGASLAGQPRADYVELYNAGSTSVTLTGWSVQAAQPTAQVWSVVPLSGTIGPRKYLLVQMSPSGIVGTNLPAIDVGPGSVNLNELGGKVALVQSTVGLSGRPVCPFPSNVVDFVGYGTADQRTPCSVAAATASNAPAASFTTALFRKCEGIADVGGNNETFELRAPQPRNSATPANTLADIALATPNPVVSIFAGQSALISAQVTVSPCAGVVTGVTANLSPIGGSATAALALQSGNTYSLSVPTPGNLAPGAYTINIAASASRTSERGTGKVTLLVRPPNDECTAPIVVTPASLPVTLNMNNDAAQPDVDVGICTASAVGDFGVWYAITPSAGGVLRIEQIGTQLAAIGVFTGDCAALSSVACAGNGQLSLNVGPGIMYRVLVVRDGATPALAPALSVRFSFSTIAPNDQPCQAFPLVLGQVQQGSNVDATDANDGPLVSCSSVPIAATQSVWYTFTPSVTGLYRLSSCGSPIDTDLALFTVTGCPGAPALVSVAGACATAGCLGGEPGPGPGLGSVLAAEISNAPLTAGVTYHLRVSSAGTPLGGAFRLLVTRIVTGACCNLTNGACTITSTGACPSGLTYLGPDTVCTPTNCQPAMITGACCNYTSGACTITTNGSCAAGLTFLGQNSSCTPLICVRNNDECPGAIPIGVDVPTFGSTAGVTTSVSINTFQCGTVNGSDGNDVFFLFVPPSTTTYQFSLCGSDFDTVLGVHNGCPTTLLNRLACSDDASPACSGNDLASRVPALVLNAGTPYYIRVSGFNQAAGRFALEVNQAGICCRGSTCTTQFATPAACASAATAEIRTSFVGAVTSCNLPGVTTFPCCHADFNKSSSITSLDLFDYLNAWFTSSPFAKFGGDGTQPPVVADLFEFINAWFVGGC